MFLLTVLPSKGQQDPIFTQYMFNNQSINPAYAGMWDKIGFIALVRKQWIDINRAPFTQMISLHTPVKNDYAGLGLNVINDRFGREERLSIFADYSYMVMLNPDRLFLRLGLKFGFMNYQNPLTEYILYDDQYDYAFQQDVDLKFLPNFGVGAFLYKDHYYISLAIPKMIENDFGANRNNYTSLAEVRHFYLGGGYVRRLNHNVVFKPTMMFRAAIGAPVQLDLTANFLLWDKLWAGAMVRTGDAFCIVTQWIFSNNVRIGYAMDITFSDLYRHQGGTYEFTMSYEVDFYGRSYIRPKYF